MIWRHGTDEPKMAQFSSTPALYGGKVYICPDDGNFYILDAETGDEIRKVAMGTYKSATVSLGQHNIRSSPIIYNGRIYVGSLHDNKTYCLDPSGNIVWATDLGSEIVGSVGIADGYIYMMAWDRRMYKMDMTGTVVLDFSINTTGDSRWSGFFQTNSQTPIIVGDRLWIGGTNNRLRCWNVTDGTEIYSGVQPNIRGENSHGGAVYIPDWALITRNATSGETFPNIGGVIISQAGPTVVAARADNGSNIWSNWGGWEVWSTPVFSGIGNSAVAYFGSDSGSIQIVNASDGMPVSWFTTGGNIVGSACLYDGKLYIGSYDNNLYCFEDRNTQEMAISISTDKTEMDVGDSVTVTLQLTKIPDVNVYEEIGRPAPVPGLPDAPVLVTFTKPDGVTEITRSATTDKLGWASVTFEPDEAGTWKIITWYEGEDRPTFAYGYAFSDEATVEVTGGAEPTPTPTSTPTGTELPVEYVWAAVAVVVIVVVVLAVLLFLRRR
jgi:outer membrane protein assembly factor BamB